MGDAAMRGNPVWLVIVLLVGTAISLVGLLIGDWWLTFPAGLLVGVAITPVKLAVPTGALAGLLGWVLPLAADQARYGIGPAAGSLAAVMGYTGQSAVPLILTCMVGLLLGLTGAWLASAARLLLAPRAA
jgi:hypothetical protein